MFTWLYGILLNVNRKRSRTIFRLIFTDKVPEREAQDPIGPASSADALRSLLPYELNHFA